MGKEQEWGRGAFSITPHLTCCYFPRESLEGEGLLPKPLASPFSAPSLEMPLLASHSDTVPISHRGGPVW